MSDDIIEIVLEGPPKGKGRPRFNGTTGHAYTDANTRAYELKLAWQAKAQMGPRPPFSCPLHISVIAYMPIPKALSKADKEACEKGDIVPTNKPDLDNILKMIDGLNGVVWKDDSQIVLASVCKFYSPNPRLRISVGRYNARGLGDDVVSERAGDAALGRQP